MKKNKTERYAIIVIALALIGLILVSGTFAKYTSTATGSDTVKVAKWSVKVGTTEIANATQQTYTFDLFSTIKDSDLTSAEENVKENLIAPGTSGSFDLVVKNESEVDAKYTATFQLANTSNIPLEFKVGDGEWVKPAADGKITGISITDESIPMTGTTQTSTKTVQWRWAYEGASSTNYASTQTDGTDTDLGIAAQTTAPEATITATVVATQVD